MTGSLRAVPAASSGLNGMPNWLVQVPETAWEDRRPFLDWMSRWCPTVTVAGVWCSRGPYLRAYNVTQVPDLETRPVPVQSDEDWDPETFRHTGQPSLLLHSPQGWTLTHSWFQGLERWHLDEGMRPETRRRSLAEMFSPNSLDFRTRPAPSLRALADTMHQHLLTPAMPGADVHVWDLQGIEDYWQVLRRLDEDQRAGLLTLLALALPEQADVLADRDVVEQNLPRADDAVHVLEQVLKSANVRVHALRDQDWADLLAEVLANDPQDWVEVAGDLIAAAEDAVTTMENKYR